MWGCAQSVSCVWLFVTPWTVACQTLLSMEFPRQEYWSGLPLPPPGDLPNGGQDPRPLFPASAGRFLTTEPPGTPVCIYTHMHIACVYFICFSGSFYSTYSWKSRHYKTLLWVTLSWQALQRQSVTGSGWHQTPSCLSFFLTVSSQAFLLTVFQQQKCSCWLSPRTSLLLHPLSSSSLVLRDTL